jgi:hypothetical protein
MSYRWKQETVPMTSILILQRALDECGFQVVGSSKLIDELRAARLMIDSAKTNDEKILAYDALVRVIEKCDDSNSLPKKINLHNFSLSLNNSFRYEIGGVSESSNIAPSELANWVSRLNDTYKRIAKELDRERHSAETSSMNHKMRAALERAVQAEKASIQNSVKIAKQKMSELILKNAQKNGFSVKRNVFTNGKNAGREQYVVVKRR